MTFIYRFSTLFLFSKTLAPFQPPSNVWFVSTVGRFHHTHIHSSTLFRWAPTLNMHLRLPAASEPDIFSD